MKRRVDFWMLVLLLGIMVLGCDPPTPVAGGAPAPPPPPGSAPPPPPAATEPAAAAPLPPESKFGVFAGGIDDLAARPSAPPAQPASPPADPGTERVKAQAGVGAKGRSLDNEQGLLVTPVKVYFRAQERIAFEQAFYGQYRLYRATEDVPKDYDELKAKVLDPYQIKLPLLPRGHKYVWDAATEELQVEKPKPQ